MARYGYSSSRSSSGRSYRSSSSSRSSGRSGYAKSYNNSTKQTCAQRYSPTKTSSGTWYDAGGSRVQNTKAYFNTINSNGKYWKDC